MSLPTWLLLSSGLLAVAVVLGLLAARVGLQLTVVLVFVGFAARFAGDSFGLESPLEGDGFEEVVVFLFLPVLVFEAALGLSVRAFFRNLGPILVLAIVALLVSAVLVGAALALVLDIPLAAALLFGALISATDPVAVVAVFRQLGVPERLLVLVEGESMLNDGVAIVLFTILLSAALGADVSVAGGIVDFVVVFFGGAAIGALFGIGVAVLLPWLDRNLTATLTVAVAYGSFVLADHILGFSGVMAGVSAGIVIAGFAPSRGSADARKMLEQVWEALGFVANALLFLLIGLAIEPVLIREHLGAIALAIVVVLVARAAAIVPVVSALERIAHIPRVGRRNEAVLIWGGLRGGVALALALALPTSLPEHDMFVAMTGGVVLATLLLNATTIGWLIHRLGLDEPSRAARFLAAVARLEAARAASSRLDELGVQNEDVVDRLDEVQRAARDELERIELSADEEVEVITRQGLLVERQVYQRLSDAGLLQPTAARTLLHEVDDHIDEVVLGRSKLTTLGETRPPRGETVVQHVAARIPRPAGEDPSEIAYSEAMARRLAARRTLEALELFKDLPNVHDAAVEGAREVFCRREDDAERALVAFDADGAAQADALHRRMADALARVAAGEALAELTEVGLLPEVVARDATRALSAPAATS
ncbi:MAG: sodium:proton antiporter [Actinobacteria bacterium]|nr:sodium:proton antiporter [Actinomycetota bacterium]